MIRSAFAVALCVPLFCAQAQGPAPDPAAEAAPERRPRLLSETCSPPQYPHDALAASETGRTLMRFQVDAQGRARQVEIARSNASARLNEAARAAFAGCRFQPAMAAGVAVDGVALVEYVWKIDGLPPPPPLPSSVSAAPQAPRQPFGAGNVTLLTARNVERGKGVSGITDAFGFEGLVHVFASLRWDEASTEPPRVAEVRWFNGEKLVHRSRQAIPDGAIRSSGGYFNFTASPIALGEGTCRVEVDVNDKPVGSRTFTVKAP